MAEVQIHGRHELVAKTVDAESFVVRLAAITTAIIAIGGLGATVVLLVLGFDVVSLLTAVPAVLLAIARLVSSLRNKGDDSDGLT